MEALERRLEAKAHKETVRALGKRVDSVEKYMPSVLNARAKGPVADEDEDGVEVTHESAPVVQAVVKQEAAGSSSVPSAPSTPSTAIGAKRPRLSKARS